MLVLWFCMSFFFLENSYIYLLYPRIDALNSWAHYLWILFLLHSCLCLSIQIIGFSMRKLTMIILKIIYMVVIGLTIWHISIGILYSWSNFFINLHLLLLIGFDLLIWAFLRELDTLKPEVEFKYRSFFETSYL